MDALNDRSYRRALEQHLACLLINQWDELIYCSPAAKPYVRNVGDTPSPSILDAIDPAIRFVFSTALVQARRQRCLTLTRPISLDRLGTDKKVQALIAPFETDEAGVDRLLVTFNVFSCQDTPIFSAADVDAADQALVSELYAELMRSKDEFHRLTIKHEEGIKNLAAMNEDLCSINEELRCATEELQQHRTLLEAGNASLNEMVERVTKANHDLENFVDNTELALVFVDTQFCIVRYTRSAASLFNFIPKDVGRPLLDISHNFDYQRLEEDIRHARDDHRRQEREIRSCQGGWFHVRVFPSPRDGDVIDGVILTFVDITLRKQAEEKLHLGEQRWKLAIEASGDGIWDWDVATNKSFLSPSWRQIIGYDRDEFPGETLEAWEALVHPDDRHKVAQNIRACARGDPSWFSHEYRIHCKGGHWKWVLSRGAVVERDHRGKVARIVGTLTDISQKKMLEDQIWHRANFDALTGLPNRNFFLDRLDYEVRHAERANQPFALLFIDLDRFKEVNDLHGHSAGDLLLKVVADELQTCIRESDTVARLGGDEFTVVLTGTRDTTHVELIAENILKKLSQPIDLAGNVVHISGSIGITFFPKDADTAADLVRNADQAMYVAKNAGRNQCRFFSQAMQDAALNRISMMQDLHDATKGQLALCFQPIVDMHSGAIVKAEALLRWRHPTRGLVLPDQFIHLAEEAGLIGSIGDWVFQQAANSALQISHLLGRPFQISINKSPLELSSNGFPKVDLISYLDDIGLDKRNIVIEITEGVLLHATPQVKERLASLRDAGIQFALDDFGTGYSSMSYLTRYHVDFLKIDQSFVRHRTPNAPSSAIAEAMIVLAHKLGLKVIAEGVERQDQHDWLSAAGCDYSQGFLYAHPLELAKLEVLIKKTAANLVQTHSSSIRQWHR